MKPFDQAWTLLKMPYVLEHDPDGEEHDVLYQGGKEGDKDSGYWTPDIQEALGYGVYGSDFHVKPRQGLPIVRQTLPTTERVVVSPEHEGLFAGSGFFPHTNVPSEELIPIMEEIIEERRLQEGKGVGEPGFAYSTYGRNPGWEDEPGEGPPIYDGGGIPLSSEPFGVGTTASTLTQRQADEHLLNQYKLMLSRLEDLE